MSAQETGKYGEPWETAEQTPAILTRNGLTIDVACVDDDVAITTPTWVLLELRDRILAEHAACAGADDPKPGELAELRAALERIRGAWPHIETPVGPMRFLHGARPVADPGAPTCLRCKIEEVIRG